MRQCPFCGELVEDTTSKCPFCGSDIKPQQPTDISGENGGNQNSAQVYDVNNKLSNGMKVFLSMIATIPLVGQLVGIIMGIVFMNSENDPDRRAFGKALLIGTLVIFFVSCLCCAAYFVWSVAFISNNPDLFKNFPQLQ